MDATVEYEREDVMKELLEEFTKEMLNEIEDNSAKGDFERWNPDVWQLISELDHHLNKLKLAMLEESPYRTTEHAADVANYCMKAHQLFGK